ncbi:MAG: 3-phosphoshikimate 1-carboxyvinyltransferase [Opitutaceae bacterium]|nr:3-phosphoshikimate 1-carboxyvinyltransferase [Opitutaceae bacterium]
MPLPDILPITPFTRPARGVVALPGSKSLTNRALLLAALCERPVTLTGALASEDTHLMAEALRKLGFTVAGDETTHTLRVADQARGFPASANVQPVDLFVGLAGTAARFLTALCAAAPRGTYRLDGVPQMRKRPMKPLIDALRALGADVRCTGAEGFFPLEIHARGLRGGAVSIDASESSQLLSALLMVAPLAATPITITLVGGVRWPFVAMTINQMAQLGYAQKLTRQGDTLAVPLGRYAPPASYAIEPDATASSYFTALPLAVGGTIHVANLLPPAQGLQGDAQFLAVLERVGATIVAARGDVDVAAPPRTALRGVTQDFSEFSDTFLTLAALAPLLAGPTRISGIAHSRKQETDRVAGMARELTKLGQHVVEEHDALTITPRPLKPGVEIETYGDHRFAMSFGILGCHNLHGDGRPWLSVKNPACCAKTFPHFFELLETVRQNSLAP